MAMIVRTNMNSMNANRNLSINNSQVAKSIQKLASGYAINSAADDASGLAVTEKMRAQITGLDQGTENALDGVCLVQTAEGAMDEIHNMLNRMVELSTKSANGTIQDEVDREAIQAEVDVLVDEIDRIAKATNYNGIPLLDGSLAGGGSCGSTEGTTGNGSVTLNIDTSKTATVGSFTVTGGVQGVDFDYNTTTGELTILSSTHMRIEGGSNTESIVVDDVAGSANLALKDVSITNANGSAFSTGNNDVYVELEGVNVLSSTYGGTSPSTHGSAGLNVGEFGSITIDGKGELTATGGTYAAGIGSDYKSVVGDITINGGTIYANGGANASGIGSGNANTIATGGITINGGTIYATGDTGIGAGDGAIGDITITGGTIIATGNFDGAGIGSGQTSSVGDITITGGDVIATGGTNAPGIGSGYSTVTNPSSAGDITITGGNVTAIGGTNGAGIGTGDTYGSYGNIGSYTGNITYVEECVTATGGSNAESDIGKGGVYTSVGTITKIPLGSDNENVDSTTCGQGLILHVADENENYNKIQVFIDPMTGEALEIDPLDVSTQEEARLAIDKIKNAINHVSENRGNLGALQNRLEHTVNNNNNTSENMSSAVSTIKDTDMASEMMKYTTMNVLVQSAQSMLAQSNQAPQSILELLG